MNNLKVDILMMTYNHEQYIAQAIESVLSQKTNFDIRIIIGEDCSKDNTLNICKDYAIKFPNKILLVNQETNIGHQKNAIEIYNRVTAPYIALCEGDDYWTDENKLQKQVDFLENNKDFIICFHPVEEIRQDGSIIISNKDQKLITDITDLINGWYMNTASYIFRNAKKISFPAMFFKVKATDLCFHILIAEDGGKIYFMNDIMSAYRRHEGGVTDEKADYIYHLRKNIPFYTMLIEYLKSKGSEKIKVAENKLKEINNILFYQLLYKKKKSINDYLDIIKLGFVLKKYKAKKA